MRTLFRDLITLAAAAVLLALPVLAMAADPLEVAAAVDVPWLPIVVTVVSLVVVFGTTFGLWSWVRRKVNELGDYAAEKTGIQFLAHVDEVLVGFAVDLYETEIKAAKEAAEDGKLTPEEKARFKDILINKAKQHFGISRLASMVSTGAPADIDAALRARAEVAVLEAKARGAAAKAVKPLDPSLASPQG